MVDITGSGRAVIELMNEAGLKPLTVVITNGTGEKELEHDAWRIAKVELVSNLQMLYQTKKLKTA